MKFQDSNLNGLKVTVDTKKCDPLTNARYKSNTLPPTSNWSLFKLNFSDHELMKLK